MCIWKQKCVLHYVAFWWNFSIFQFSVFTENGNFQFFLKSFLHRFFFGFITHTIKLFQTVQIQKGRLSFVSPQKRLKNMKKSKWCKTSFEEYIM